jgi:hypothetical protein
MQVIVVWPHSSTAWKHEACVPPCSLTARFNLGSDSLSPITARNQVKYLSYMGLQPKTAGMTEQVQTELLRLRFLTNVLELHVCYNLNSTAFFFFYRAIRSHGRHYFFKYVKLPQLRPRRIWYAITQNTLSSMEASTYRLPLRLIIGPHDDLGYVKCTKWLTKTLVYDDRLGYWDSSLC